MSVCLKYPEPRFTILPFDNIVPDWLISGSKPANESIWFGLLNLEMLPNSEMIEAHDIAPIPVIERVGGLSSLIIVEISLSIELILEFISKYRLRRIYNSNSKFSLVSPMVF